tara:strand:+ start:1765 stop:2403 length:639 start_codon:yes stop_codon:yes gene_type:complete
MANNDKRFLFSNIVQRGIEEGFKPGDSDASREWFRKNAQKLRDIRPDRLMRRPGANVRANLWRPGDMYLFRYHPQDVGIGEKHDRKLPYYDRFPLVMITKIKQTWFEGINFHYLRPEHRIMLLDRMYQFMQNDDFLDPNNHLVNATYKRLNQATSGRDYEKAAVKRYINNQVQSRFIKIHPAEWDMVVLLPLDRFVGANRNRVWAESKEKFM